MKVFVVPCLLEADLSPAVMLTQGEGRELYTADEAMQLANMLVRTANAARDMAASVAVQGAPELLRAPIQGRA